MGLVSKIMDGRRVVVISNDYKSNLLTFLIFLLEDCGYRAGYDFGETVFGHTHLPSLRVTEPHEGYYRVSSPNHRLELNSPQRIVSDPDYFRDVGEDVLSFVRQIWQDK
jgi:hypothetical protein